MKFLFLRILLSLTLLAGAANIGHADADVVEWDDYSLYTDYDSSDEELEIKFATYSDGNPDEDFFLEMEVGDEDCEMDLEYSSFQVKGECVVSIDEGNMKGLYETTIVVLDEDDNEVHEDTSVEFEVEGFEEEFEWDDLIVDAIYEQEDEKIEMKIYLENVSSDPSYEYEIEFKIDGKTFSKDFRWDEDEEELYVDVATSIDEDEIEDEYEIDFEVFNKDEDDEEVGDGELEFDVDIISDEDDYDWDDIEYSAVYDEDTERLYLDFYLSDISSEPNARYESFIEFEGEDYDKRFNYDDDTEQLIAEYTIKIDEEDLGYFYDIELIVEDEDEDEVFDDEVDVDIEFLSEADDFDWDELTVTASYDEDAERIYIELVLEDITSTPTFTYATDIEFADEEEFAVFKYDSTKDELRASIDTRIDEDDIEDEYEIEIEVNNTDENDEVYDEDIAVEVENHQDVVQASSADYDWDGIEINFDYTTQTQYLTIEVELDNVTDYPTLDYFVELNISGIDDEIGSKLRYDSQEKRLYGTYNIYIKESDIEDDYNLTTFINDEYGDLQHLLTEKFDVIFDRDEAEEETKYVSAATTKAVDNFVKKIYKRYDSRSDALAYFKIVITTLDTYANSKTRYRSVIDDINYLLQQEIDN